MRYNCTRNFEACGHAQSKKMQKFLLRSALQPNQISFSHGLGHELPRHLGGSAVEVPPKPAAHSGITEEPTPQCSRYEPVPDGHQKLISRVSAIVKTDADNRMALSLSSICIVARSNAASRNLEGSCLVFCCSIRRAAISELTPIIPALFAFMLALSACDARAAAVKSSGVKVPSGCGC